MFPSASEDEAAVCPVYGLGVGCGGGGAGGAAGCGWYTGWGVGVGAGVAPEVLGWKPIVTHQGGHM